MRHSGVQVWSGRCDYIRSRACPLVHLGFFDLRQEFIAAPANSPPRLPNFQLSDDSAFQIALPPFCARLLPLTTHLRSLGPDLPDLDRFVLSAIVISNSNYLVSLLLFPLIDRSSSYEGLSTLSRSRQLLSAFATGCSGIRLWLLGTWKERQSSLVGETLICLSPAVWYDDPNSCSLSPASKQVDLSHRRRRVN